MSQRTSFPITPPEPDSRRSFPTGANLLFTRSLQRRHTDRIQCDSWFRSGMKRHELPEDLAEPGVAIGGEEQRQHCQEHGEHAEGIFDHVLT